MKTKPPPAGVGAAKRAAARVLCGIDFSAPASAAAGAAAALAKRWDAPLDLVHVTALPADPRPRKKLDDEAARLRPLGADVKPTLIEGLPDEVLVERAEPGACRLVVVASIGKRAPERWVLGSVAERTAERAAVPTLVVREAASIEAWVRGERPLRVFVAFDFSRSAEAALGWVRELRSIGACDVIIGFVDWPPEQRARLGGAGPLPLVGNPTEVQAVLERDLRLRAETILGDRDPQLRIEANWGRADVRLAEMAREERADLLVTGSHQYRGFERMWHGSVSRGLLHNAAMNVAVVPLAAGGAGAPAALGTVRSVLVATDFSEAADRAIPTACALVSRGGMLRLLHVVHPQSLPGGEFLQTLPDAAFAAAHAGHTAACGARLRALIPEEAAARGIVVDVEVADHRDPATGIVQAAERLGADVICVGKHGQTGRFDALLGSVAQKVVARSPRPVLVVPSRRE